MAKAERPTPLYPQHHSARGVRLKPPGMEVVSGMTPEHVECLERIALGIFTDMSNAGYSLSQTLASVYLSGLKHAIELLKENGRVP